MEAAARLLSRHRISVTYKLVTTPRTTLMQPKDPMGPDEKSNVVYDLERSKCPVHNVRETGKRLRARLREHKRACGQDQGNRHGLEQTRLVVLSDMVNTSLLLQSIY